MGFRLGHRIVKIWRWLKRSGTSSRPYARLHKQKRKKSVRLCIGRRFCRRSADSQALLQHSQVSLLHLPQLDLQFPHWLIAPHFHIPRILEGYKKGIEYYDSGRSSNVPKGFLAVYVGEGQEHHRFEVPVPYFNHPLFGELLKEAEDKYGFDQRGALNLPCKLSQFEKVQSLIRWDSSHKQ